DVNTAADALAQLLDQILLTGMETTAYFQPHPLDSFLFHFTEGREHLCAVRDAEDSLLREHNQMCLIKGVDGIEQRPLFFRGVLVDPLHRLLSQPDTTAPEATIFTYFACTHCTEPPTAPDRVYRRRLS